MTLASFPKTIESSTPSSTVDSADWPGIREWQSQALAPESLRRGGRYGAIKAFLGKPRGVIGFAMLGTVLAMALGAHWLFPGDPLGSVAQPLLTPGQDLAHLLGTDSLGRDVAAALFHGAGASLSVGFAAAAVGTSLGVLIGSLAGYFGGWVDTVLMRVTELFQTTPPFLFIVVLVAMLQPSLSIEALAIGLTSWQPLARMVRAEFRQLLHSDFVLAARATGLSDARIIVEEILPNVTPTIVVMASFKVATAIFLESSLAFLGLGDPNRASWGGMIEEGRDFIRSDGWLVLVPGVAILAAVLSLNLIGDALNDALNPRLRRAS